MTGKLARLLDIFITILLWGSGLVLAFLSWNVMDPYLAPARDWSWRAILLMSVIGIGIVFLRHAWTRRGIKGKVLVFVWCAIPLILGGAMGAFAFRKHAILNSDDPRFLDLGRHFIVGYTQMDEVAQLARKGLIGGIFISRRNVAGQTPDAFKAEISRLQSLRIAAGLPPLIVSTDQEGGIVSRLSPPLTAMPPLSTFADLPSEKRIEGARAYGEKQGRELASLGVTLNFAPVVDLRRDGPRNALDFNSLISRRAISGDPNVVSEIALAYVKGLASGQIGAAVKHFPGLGGVPDDTHHFRSSLETPVAALEKSDWIPFRDVLLKSKALLMIGHVTLTAIDPNRAASQSKAVIDGLIRKTWNYQGLIVTDDLVMSAVYQHGICTTVVEALNAGADLLLVTFDGQQYYRIFNCAVAALNDGRLDASMLAASAARLKAFEDAREGK